MNQPTAHRTVPDLLVARATGDPDAIALLVDGAGELSFGEWELRSRRVANSLLAAGTATGDRIGLFFSGTDWSAYAVAYLGVLRTGATALHFNAGMHPGEIARRTTLCSVQAMLASAHSGLPPGWAGRVLPLESLEGGAETEPAVEVDADGISDVLFTSGTTGQAKAYLVPHSNLTFGREPSTLRDFQGTGHMLVPMTLGTSTSATCVVATLSAPAISVMCDSEDVERMAALVQQHRIGTLAITPWIALNMVDARLHERYDLSSVQVVASGSSPLPPAISTTLLQMMPGARVMSACSQSEAGPALIINVFDPARPLSIGRPSAATELRLVDGDGADVAVGTIGEIWLRHRAPRRRYLDPVLNAGIDADGFYRTGDYGRLDDDGNLYFVDRGEDLIIIDEAIVSSIEVEAALYEHPGVREAAVVADGRGGMVATLVLRSGASAGDVVQFAGHRCGALPGPLRIELASALPRSQNGKVLKRVLREQLATAQSA
ncbi:class I adenylate-forming enzyme family protein [Jatrophihabitans sp.]|jgi:acyl-coenzyme A synthetase/AMP-(fatty) acid ligase|uniref:class I adenylate-forming enzyme family protein n=1 Tax=Jatrophihabitans sp. TaxID=1932789 RepID=UPI002F1A9FE0